MKRLALLVIVMIGLFFTSCKPEPENGENNGEKVRVSCSISMNKGVRSDFTNLMDEGKVNWSDGRECVYVAIPGDNPTIIELESWADGNPSHLVFSGEAAKGLIQLGEQYELWYFGHSQQLDEPYVSLVDGSRIEGSIARQSGSLEELGYCHIAKTTVTAELDGEEVVLNLNASLVNQMAIALLDLEGVEEIYGSAIKGTEYALAYDEAAGVFELKVTESSDAKIDVQSSEGISYVFMFPNDAMESQIRCQREGKTYAYTFHKDIKANKVYFKTAADGITKEALEWTECEDENVINGHEYVDLGLPSGLLWATCNVGANSPEEYGNHYSWGETTTKSSYDEDNCSTYGLSISELQSQGYIDGNGNLTPQHDAATANWGGSWRMPTYSELNELRNNCNWTWTTKKGVSGCKVTSKTNGNSIFLPVAGYRNGSSLDDAGDYGYYWSSTPNDANYANYDNAYYLYFYYFDIDIQAVDDDDRYYGQSVRPVSGGNVVEPEIPEIPEKPETPVHNGHEYVDLGLSVKWATCNVGANTPEEYGNYYAWGETTTKDNYSSSNCPTYGLSISELQSQGYIDGNGNLTPQYDAAAANWGGGWRMPTKDEMNELRNNCNWTWTTKKGVSGYKVTSKTNGNSIFLPAAGCRNGSSLGDAGGYGFYWGSTPSGYDNLRAYCQDFDVRSHDMSCNYLRYNGLSVRPVTE